MVWGIFGELTNPSVHMCFLYDPVAGMKEQDASISFRFSASLINTLILLLIKLFEEDRLCAPTFEPIDLTCMLPGL